MSVEENKAIVRRFVEEFWGKGNLTVADEIAAPNIVVHGSGVENMEGVEAVKQFIKAIHDSNPNASLQFDDMIAEGDKVVVRVTARGVAEPWAVITIFRIANGKLMEDWGLVGKPWN